MNYLNCPFPTANKAYYGHSLNQSNVQQFTKDGNILSLVEKLWLNGLIAIIMWIFSLILERYCPNIFILFGWIPFLRQSPLQAFRISSIYFSLYTPVTSPEFKIEFKSSTICSSMICVSVNRKLVCLFYRPVSISIFLMSSLHDLML